MPRFTEWFPARLRSRFISIRVKFLIAFSFITILFGGLNLIVAYQVVVRTAREEMDEKGLLAVNIGSEQVVDALVVEDFMRLHRIVHSLQNRDKDILYIVVSNKDKKVVAHTFPDNRLPLYFNQLDYAVPVQYLRKAKDDVLVKQYAAPLFDGKLGYLVLGLDETGSSRRGKQVTLIIGLMILFFFITGLTATVYFSGIITRPVFHVLRNVKEFRPGKKIERIPTRFNDEMRVLADGVTGMMKRLTDQDREYKRTQLKIMETEKLASIGVLASGLAHEINNPISGIEMCLHRLKKTGTPPEKRNEYLDLVNDATVHIKTVVNDLLDYVRHTEYKLEPVALNEIVTDAVALIRYRLQKNTIRLNIQLPDYPCIVKGIKSQLVQVVVNGILNAIDAIDNSGNIALALSGKGAYYSLKIIDDGVGVSDTDAGKVFDPFFTTKGTKGTGLGLYVSYNLIYAHNGTIRLSSPDTRGSVLEIRLPKGTFDENTDS